jgi:hypothetical protein
MLTLLDLRDLRRVSRLQSQIMAFLRPASETKLRFPPEIPANEGSAADLVEAAEAAHVERKENSALVARTKARYDPVQALKAQGKGIKPIMRELELAKETVRRFYRVDIVEELLAKPRAGRPSVLDAYKPYLHQRWNASCTNAAILHQEITEQGYPAAGGAPWPPTSRPSVPWVPRRRPRPAHRRSATSPSWMLRPR